MEPFESPMGTPACTSDRDGKGFPDHNPVLCHDRDGKLLPRECDRPIPPNIPFPETTQLFVNGLAKYSKVAKALLGMFIESDKVEATFRYYYETWIFPGNLPDACKRMTPQEVARMYLFGNKEQIKAAAKTYLQRRIAAQGSATELQKDQLAKIDEWVDFNNYTEIAGITA